MIDWHSGKAVRLNDSQKYCSSIITTRPIHILETLNSSAGIYQTLSQCHNLQGQGLDLQGQDHGLGFQGQSQRLDLQG